jgi:hypothetical protein
VNRLGEVRRQVELEQLRLELRHGTGLGLVMLHDLREGPGADAVDFEQATRLFGEHLQGVGSEPLDDPRSHDLLDPRVPHQSALDSRRGRGDLDVQPRERKLPPVGGVLFPLARQRHVGSRVEARRAPHRRHQRLETGNAQPGHRIARPFVVIDDALDRARDGLGLSGKLADRRPGHRRPSIHDPTRRR